MAPRPSAVYLAIGALTLPFVKLIFRLKAQGTENLPTEEGFVLSPNHLSNFDPWPLGAPLFPKRYLRFMAKAELYRFGLGTLLRGGGAFKVRRGERDTAAIDKGIELARAGHAVVIFPEGTRRKKGLVKRYQPRSHTGAARVALGAGVPLIPAAIKGTDNLLRLGPLRVAYGPPVPLDDLRGRDDRDAAQEATDRLMAEIEKLHSTL
jgi:1-acyl-sn-glycerol-3-phosphate acyltransferase